MGLATTQLMKRWLPLSGEPHSQQLSPEVCIKYRIRLWPHCTQLSPPAIWMDEAFVALMQVSAVIKQSYSVCKYHMRWWSAWIKCWLFPSSVGLLHKTFINCHLQYYGQSSYINWITEERHFLQPWSLIREWSSWATCRESRFCSRTEWIRFHFILQLGESQFQDQPR